MCPPKPIKLRGASIYAKTMTWSKMIINNIAVFKSNILNKPVATGYCETLLSDMTLKTNK